MHREATVSGRQRKEFVLSEAGAYLQQVRRWRVEYGLATLDQIKATLKRSPPLCPFAARGRALA
ncbi:hypothetical protein R70006_04897 [Paraburkholderia domus]|nr:hypothetical protein R70006_04897 [Paraburkholderia domus]CAE6796001.1 hypothetical protein R75483_05119 [Paraburkholderia domus]